MKKTLIKTFILVLGLLSLNSCSKNTFVVGEYKSTYDNQNALLQINADIPSTILKVKHSMGVCLGQEVKQMALGQ